MAEKVTKMLIKVDLQCSRCYRKIKKILCKFPQIRDQTYDEKKNTVSITVVCCSPEKIRQKIICKGGKIVQSIEILPDTPKKPENKPPTKPAEQPGPSKPQQQAPSLTPPKKEPNPVVGYQSVPVYPMVPVYPTVGMCCCPPFYGGYGGGPCYCGWGRPVMCDDGCGRPACECQGGNRGYYVSRCDYFSEENATACTVM